MRTQNWSSFTISTLKTGIRHALILPLLTAVPAQAAPAMFAPASLSDSGYTETFGISADMEDGGFAQIQLGVTNMGPGSGRAICRVLLASPKASWRAQVTLQPRGGATQKLSARVSIEHDLGTVSPDQIGQQWFRFRSMDADTLRYGFAHRIGKRNEGAGRWVTTATSPVDFTGLKIESPSEPGTGDIVFTTSTHTITLRPTRAIAAYAPLREMGLMGRILSAIVGDPLLSIVEVSWEEGAEKRKAILEVTTFR